MRVLHVYAGNLYGGIESVLATFARERPRCPSMQPHFALCFEGRLSRELRDCGANVTMLGQARVSRPWTIAAARRRMRDLLGSEKFDVAICHSYWPHGVFAPVIRWRGVPLVFWSHDIPTGKGWLQRWARRTPPDLVLANSRFTASAVPKLFPNIRCEVQYPPVSISFPADRAEVREHVRSQIGTGGDTAVIVMTARLERWKGHELLLESLGRLRDLGNWECWIAGGAQSPQQEKYLAQLQKLAEHLGVGPRVKFLGQRDDVPNLLVAADIHCQPNTGPEPFGVAFVEALAAGLPVVTTNVGAAAEIVAPNCGRLTEAEPGLVSDALARLIESRENRSAMECAARLRADSLCTPARVMGQLHGRLAELNGAKRLDPMNGQSMPLWVRFSRAVISRLPAGRYQLMNSLVESMVHMGFPPRPFIAQHAGMEGIRFHCHLSDSIAREVCYTGQYEPLETHLVRRLLGSDQTFVDVGANWGYFTLLGSRLVGPAGRVVSIEPDPRLFELLTSNARLNRLSNVIALKLAAADRDETLMLHGFEESAGNWGLSRIDDRGEGPRFAVAARPLDQVLSELNIGEVRLIKMDIEGAEDAALRGMCDGLRDRRYICIILEIHPGILSSRNVAMRDLLEPLLSAGYRGWQIDHSAAVTRRVSYHGASDIRALLRPVSPEEPQDAWPHQLWLSPKQELTDVI